MNTKVNKSLNKVGKWTKRNGPKIFMGIGVVGMFVSTGLAIKATPKAMELIEEKEKETGEKLSTLETVKVAWKPYIPAIATAVSSTICIISAHSASEKRAVAFATAYQLSSTAFEEYKGLVIDEVGEEVEKRISEKLAEKKIEESRPINKIRDVRTNDASVNMVIFYDIKFGTELYSTKDIVKDAVNEINYTMMSGGQYASVNDFYDLLNIDPIGIGDDLGWNVSKDGMLKIDCNSVSLTKDGRPCFVIEYLTPPKYDFYKS